MSNWAPPGHGGTGDMDDTVWRRPDRGDTELYRLVQERLDDADARLVRTVGRLSGLTRASAAKENKEGTT